LSWLPPPPTPSGERLRPWQAPSLSKKRVKVADLTYIVVDETVGGIVGLSLSPWPAADHVGRLRFAVDQDPVHVAVDLPTLCEFLLERGLRFVPAGPMPEKDERPLFIGTTFAARVHRTQAKVWRKPLRRWIPGRVYDITGDAREVAKLAHYGAVTERWNQDQAAELGLTDIGG